MKAHHVAIAISITGHEALDRELAAIAAVDGAKSLNKALAGVLRDTVNEIVKPDVLARIPVNTGFLESQVKVRTRRNWRRRVVVTCGFPDPMFTGDTFYGAFLEYGWRDPRGFDVPADSFLRAALWPNQTRIIDRARTGLRNYIDERNRVGGPL